MYATEAERKENVYTGKISGQICTGENKLKDVTHLMREEQSICYGDSEGDYALMNACSNSFLVKHKKKSFTEKVIYLLRTISGIPVNESENSVRIIPFKNGD